MNSLGCQAALDSLLFCPVDGGGVEPNSCTGFLGGDGRDSDGYQVGTTLTFVLYKQFVTLTIVDMCFK